MTESEQLELFYGIDFASILLNLPDRSEYPSTLEKDGFYGLFLLARCAAGFLMIAAGSEEEKERERYLALMELAHSYIEASQTKESKGPARHISYTYSLVSLLSAIPSENDANFRDEDCYDFINSCNHLIDRIEASRSGSHPIRNADIRLAKQWCRILRVYSFLRLPVRISLGKYTAEHDIKIAARRGIHPGALLIVDFRIRFYRCRIQGKPGKLILLAEEWEILCKKQNLDYDPHKFEIRTLSYLDSEENYRIGLEWVDMLIMRKPDKRDFYKWKIRFLRRAREYSQALTICKDLIAEDREDHEVYYLSSNLSFLNGEFAEARRSGALAVRYGDSDPASHLALGFAYLYDGYYDRAIRSFQKSLDLNPDLVEALRGKSKAMAMIGDSIRSMECLRKAIRLAPDDADLYHDLADVYFMCGYLDECRKYCKKCLSLDPSCAGAYVLLGMLEIRKNHDSLASKWLSRALEIEPANPIALNELAYVYHLNGNDDECLRLLEKALKIAPDFPDVLCSLGVVYYFRSEFDRAQGYYERTLDLDPDHPGALIGLGNLFLAQSQAEDAIFWFDKALLSEPDNPDAIHGKISAYRAMGLEQEAFEWMQKAGDLGIDSDEDFPGI